MSKGFTVVGAAAQSIEKRRNLHFGYECPHCHQPVHLTASSNLILHEVTPVLAASPEPAVEARIKFSPREAAIIERAENTGIFKAFTEAMNAAPVDQPKDPHVYFLHFLRTMRMRQIPGDALQHFKNRHPGGYIEFYGAQGIVCVSVQGVIKQFVPSEILLGQPIRKLGGRQGGTSAPRFDVDETELLDWIKTKRGYVPTGSQEFLDALKKQSLGEFGRPMVSGS